MREVWLHSNRRIAAAGLIVGAPTGVRPPRGVVLGVGLRRDARAEHQEKQEREALHRRTPQRCVKAREYYRPIWPTSNPNLVV